MVRAACAIAAGTGRPVGPAAGDARGTARLRCHYPTRAGDTPDPVWGCRTAHRAFGKAVAERLRTRPAGVGGGAAVAGEGDGTRGAAAGPAGPAAAAGPVGPPEILSRLEPYALSSGSAPSIRAASTSLSAASQSSASCPGAKPRRSAR